MVGQKLEYFRRLDEILKSMATNAILTLDSPRDFGINHSASRYNHSKGKRKSKNIGHRLKYPHIADLINMVPPLSRYAGIPQIKVCLSRSIFDPFYKI